MPDTVVNQATPQQQAVAGAGASANPWEVYGLNTDGTPIAEKKIVGDPAAEKNALEQKVAELENKLAKIPEGFEALSKKVALVDKLMSALKGEEPKSPDADRFQEIWSDLKKVAGSQAPGVQKLLSLLENDPQWIDKMQAANTALMAQHVIGLNERAHDRVMELAKKAGFKGSTDGDLGEMVFPFESAMTQTINNSPELRQAFLSGNINVIDDIFNRLIKPHVSQRLREKQARSNSAFGIPKSPPKGGAQAAPATEETKKSNLRSPQGRADFHKQAVAKWLGKQSSDE